MEFRRKVYDELLEWKSMFGLSAAMIQGARRVGMSTVVKRFAREQYKSHIMIDFVEVDKSLTDLFVDYKADLDMLFNRLQLITSVKLHRRSSVTIFDEVQAFPPAREMIKALVRDGRYD